MDWVSPGWSDWTILMKDTCIKIYGKSSVCFALVYCWFYYKLCLFLCDGSLFLWLKWYARSCSICDVETILSVSSEIVDSDHNIKNGAGGPLSEYCILRMDPTDPDKLMQLVYQLFL